MPPPPWSHLRHTIEQVIISSEGLSIITNFSSRPVNVSKFLVCAFCLTRILAIPARQSLPGVHSNIMLLLYIAVGDIGHYGNAGNNVDNADNADNNVDNVHNGDNANNADNVNNTDNTDGNTSYSP